MIITLSPPPRERLVVVLFIVSVTIQPRTLPSLSLMRQVTGRLSSSGLVGPSAALCMLDLQS